MARKKYQVKTACPQCGCTELTVLSAEEIKEKYDCEDEIMEDVFVKGVR